jgi:hypothetical protein
MPVPASVREREEERLMHRLRLLLLRSATIVEEAEGRRVTNRGVLRQLRVLRDAMVRGHYVLDTVRYDAGGGDWREEEDGRKKEMVSAFASSRFNPAKRARCESSPETTATAGPARRRASSFQLQRMVHSLEAIMAGAKELAVFLTACPPMSCRQPYSAYLFLDKCMFGRHAERDQVLEFLLQAEPPEPVTAANPGPGVLPIVGPALIGKSTLVEHVCNDERVRSHFSLILLHAAAGSAGLGGLETMATTLRDNCATKHQNNTTEDERWLLIIELSGDVEDEAWNSLFYSRGRCMPWGSKVILTSRSEKIERFGTTRAVRLRCLSTEAMWYFFKLSAFGSADPDENPKLASVAMDMAVEARGSFITANVVAAMVRADLSSQQLWCKVLATVRHYMRKNIVLFGEYPDDLKAKDRPRRTWSINKLLKPNESFRMYETYQKCSAQPQQEDLPDPEVTIMDMMFERARPRGRFDMLIWKSVLPPYFSYICPCEIPDTYVQ